MVEEILTTANVRRQRCTGIVHEYPRFMTERERREEGDVHVVLTR